LFVKNQSHSFPAGWIHEDVLFTQPADNVEDIYVKTIAEKFAYDKKLIVKGLAKHGIQSILSTPQELSINTINRYLELKAKQRI
jgi:hypothetical protein